MRHEAQADLVQSVPRRPTRRTTAALMRHPGVSLILATGGTAMVKAAYSSGTPAIGVGPGIAQPPGSARMPTSRQPPDGGGQQGLRPWRHLRLGEQPGRRPVGARHLHRRAAQGHGRRLNAAERDRRDPGRLRRDGRLRRSVLGQAATSIAAAAGVEAPAGTRPCGVPVPRQAMPGPVRPGKARPAALAVHRRWRKEHDGIRLCLQILGNSSSVVRRSSTPATNRLRRPSHGRCR